MLIGVADGAFAAEQTARRGLVIPYGGSPQFLAGLPVGTLDPSGNSPLIGLLRRLGLRTLGAFAEFPPAMCSPGSARRRMGASAGRRTGRSRGGGPAPPVELTATLDLDHRSTGWTRRLRRPKPRRTLHRRPGWARPGLHLPGAAGAERERRGDATALAARRRVRPGRRARPDSVAARRMARSAQRDPRRRGPAALGTDRDRAHRSPPAGLWAVSARRTSERTSPGPGADPARAPDLSRPHGAG